MNIPRIVETKIEAYPEAEFSVINQNNYLNWITSQDNLTAS
jgi:hypothetical protein